MSLRAMLRGQFSMPKPNGGLGEFLDREIAELAPSVSDDAKQQELKRIITAAWDAGQSIGLSDVIYGPAHWDGGKKFHDEPFPYYNFLAGFVRTQGIRKIFEIGSHYGGSILAMHEGLPDTRDADFLTADISDLNPKLHSIAGITKLTGDANEETVIKQVLVHFRGEPIDLLYIDADHNFEPTITNLGLYCFLLRPRFVIIDDIALNDRMEVVWNALRVMHRTLAINCCDVIPSIRSASVGFGLLLLR